MPSAPKKLPAHRRDRCQSAALGKFGEFVAAQYLKTLGYTILAKNFRHIGFEIDLIAELGDSLCAVEIKTRTAQPIYRMCAHELLATRKLNALAKGLSYFRTINRLTHNTLRIDFALVVISNAKPRLYYWKDVGGEVQIT